MEAIYYNLAEKLAEQNIGIAELADIAGISPFDVTRRLTGETDWKLDEVVKICHFFDCYNVDLLFVRFDTNCNKEQSQV